MQQNLATTDLSQRINEITTMHEKAKMGLWGALRVYKVQGGKKTERGQRGARKARPACVF